MGITATLVDRIIATTNETVFDEAIKAARRLVLDGLPSSSS